MRIISGSAKGRTILAPKGQQTRPTLDGIRESLFNIIQMDVPDSNVLDLFSGTGALALEALSRGAEAATLVDKSRLAIDCIRRNVETLGFADKTAIIPGDWKRVLPKLAGQKYDLVFLDPPYVLTQYHLMAEELSKYDLLSDRALIIIEHQKDVEIHLPHAFTLTDCRSYRGTIIHFYRFSDGGNANGN